MKKAKALISDELIVRRILFIRNQKIIVDTDLALLYDVSTIEEPNIRYTAKKRKP